MLSKLKQRAALLSQTLTPDGGGGFTESWQIVGQMWVEITPLGASEKFGPDAVETRVRHRLVTRARDDIVAGLRVVAADRTFTIRAVLEREDPLLTLLCEELP
jgi:SPP1 family predicted phage head-tail adaptor